MVQDDPSTDDRARLLAAARARLSAGDTKFSVSALCAQTGIARETFRTHFSGKAALIAALAAPAPTTPVSHVPEPSVPEPPVPETKAASSEPGVSTPDAWLERRLRVFERALTALEAKADTSSRENALAIARLEEMLTMTPASQMRAPAPQPAPEPQAERQIESQAEPPVEPPAAAGPVPEPDLLPTGPAPMVSVSKEEMIEVLQAARTKVSVASETPAPDRNARLRWLAVGVLSLVVLLFCVGLTMGETAGAQAVGQGVAYRHVSGGTAQLMARADFGDANAQAQLALAYLRGGDTESAQRWSAAASQSGQPVGQYLAGALAQDKAQAFRLFQAAAAQGNLKAMHNLAIAYAQGDGTQKDERQAADWFARAAERGYIDSAFDLAVLYERGLGVQQDLRQALKWYGVAARAGDVPSKERVAFLHTQMTPADIELADAAARDFAPLRALDQANSL